MLSLFDALINVLLAPIVNDLTPKDSRIFFGARPKTQPLQLMHTCHLVIEKGMDRKSQGCIAQGDIKKFYDRLRCTMIAEFLFVLGEAATQPPEYTWGRCPLDSPRIPSWGKIVRPSKELFSNFEGHPFSMYRGYI